MRFFLPYIVFFGGKIAVLRDFYSPSFNFCSIVCYVFSFLDRRFWYQKGLSKTDFRP